MSRLAGAALLLAALAFSGALAQDTVPAPDGWVTDLAEMLEPQQESALESLMESYAQGSGHEIALLTVDNLGGRSLERYGLEVAREWRLGKADEHNGALLLVARRERKIRIEVGRGLEGVLTDSVCGRIIRDVISPELARGRNYEGLRAGIEALHAAAGGGYVELPPGASGSDRSERSRLLPLLILILVFFLLSRGRRGGCLLPWLVLGPGRRRSSGWHRGFPLGGGFGGGGGGGFGGFGGGGGFSGGGASGSW